MAILLTAFFTVLILLAVSAGGFIMQKRGMVCESCIPGFSKVLLYVCQPCLAIYTIYEADRSVDSIKRLLVFAGLLAVIFLLVMGGAFLLLPRDPTKSLTLAWDFGVDNAKKVLDTFCIQ